MPRIDRHAPSWCKHIPHVMTPAQARPNRDGSRHRSPASFDPPARSPSLCTSRAKTLSQLRSPQSRCTPATATVREAVCAQREAADAHNDRQLSPERLACLTALMTFACTARAESNCHAHTPPCLEISCTQEDGSETALCATASRSLFHMR